MSNSHNPIIVIGMHRSGTTMITRLLELMGLFVGESKDANHEAVFFEGINQWFISQAGATWDHPQSLHDVIGNQEVRGLITNYAKQYLLRSPRAISFLGWRRYLRYRSPLDLDIPWGWKS